MVDEGNGRRGKWRSRGRSWCERDLQDEGWARGKNGRGRLTKRAEAFRVVGEEEDRGWEGRTA